MNKHENIVKEEINHYFDEQYDAIEEFHVAKYGYKTYEPKALLNFYKNEISVNLSWEAVLMLDRITIRREKGLTMTPWP